MSEERNGIAIGRRVATKQSSCNRPCGVGDRARHRDLVGHAAVCSAKFNVQVGTAGEGEVAGDCQRASGTCATRVDGALVDQCSATRANGNRAATRECAGAGVGEARSAAECGAGCHIDGAGLGE